MTTLHVVVPEGFDDPGRPSGGNRYDLMICRGLAEAGWDVRINPAVGAWPWPDDAAIDALSETVRAIPDGSVVLVDGLIASMAPAVLVPAAARVSLVVLVHMALGAGPPGHEVPDAAARERAVLRAAVAVIATSSWTRAQLLEHYSLQPDAVHVAAPGAAAAPAAVGTESGGELVCVSAVTSHKGHDVLAAALAELTDLRWRCTCVGALDREPEFVTRVRRQVAAAGIGDRVRFVGTLTGDPLDRAYADADVLVHPSRGESYGMVVTEALAHGLPVIASDVGGVPEALGRSANGHVPGLLARPEDPISLSAMLRSWLGEPDLRRRLRQAAGQRRLELPSWSTTTASIARVLAGLR